MPARSAARPAVDRTELRLAIVGAGPRGTSVLERLTASAGELLPPGARLTVEVIDPAPPGAGRVWRTDQSPELLMNTVASQVTLFTDESVACAGPIRPGPSLYEWAARYDIAGADGGAGAGPTGPDAYPTRAQYGRYLRWVFARAVDAAPERVTVTTYATHAVHLDDEAPAEAASEPTTDPGTGPRPSSGTGTAHADPGHATAADRRQRLTLADGRQLTGLHAVILAQGHLPASAGAAERELAAYALRHRLRHVPPANPADIDLTDVRPGHPVLLRGLGLNFFDHMALLTQGRGGRYAPHGPTGALRYLPSGAEPRLYAGSRRGVPHQARGDNAKGPYGRHRPLVLTPEAIAGLRERADSGDAPDFLTDIWPLVAKEVETVYYEALLTAAGRAGETAAFRDRFLGAGAGHGSPGEAAALRAFAIPEEQYWSWDRTARPHAGLAYASPAHWRGWLLGRLREDAAHAALGNVAGPVKAALDVLRDLRNELRLVVDHGGLSGVSRRDHLDRWYTPLNAFLSIGPPRRRVEEMTALIEAGVLTVVGPRMEVSAREGHFVAHSPDVPGSTVTAGVLVEARLPEADVRRTTDELIGRLLRTGQARPHTVDGYETGGLDVTRRPYRVVDRDGRAHPRRFALGVPTEGVHWVTAAGARPGVDSVTLSDADAVARAALRATAATGPATPHRSWPDLELAGTA